MAVSRSRALIKKQARDVLSNLYRTYYEENGKYLSPDKFFPINLDKIISSVMGWNLEKVSDIGFDSHGHTLKGHCDYENRSIRIAFQGIMPGEKVFTIAHEIGHAMLHTDADRISPIFQRKRVSPRIKNTISTGREIKTEREADIFAAELLMPEKAVRDCFFSIFGTKKIWLGSTKAQQIIRGISNSSQQSILTPQSAKEIAPYFADYRKPGAHPSLREFFGVSKTAMSIRLLELNLLYE
jgi:Zn-dependent peptidase ImmA (M78 family)